MFFIIEQYCGVRDRSRLKRQAIGLKIQFRSHVMDSAFWSFQSGRKTKSSKRPNPGHISATALICRAKTCFGDLDSKRKFTLQMTSLTAAQFRSCKKNRESGLYPVWDFQFLETDQFCPYNNYWKGTLLRCWPKCTLIWWRVSRDQSFFKW